MKRAWIFLYGVFLGSVSGYAAHYGFLNSVKGQHDNGNTKILYCQEQRCDREVVEQITNAKQFAYFSVYTITRPNIVNALIGAKLRGLEIKGITDFNQSTLSEEKTQLDLMKKYGIQIETPFKKDGLMHIKMLVTDQGYVSGSFNWTTAATTYNDEVIESGNSQILRNSYLKIFQTMWNKYKSNIL